MTPPSVLELYGPLKFGNTSKVARVIIVCSTYMQGDMNLAISPDEHTMPDDSKTLLLVADNPLGFGVVDL